MWSAGRPMRFNGPELRRTTIRARRRRGYGRHSGMAGWKGSMDQRRAAMKPLPSLFVDDWWAQLVRPPPALCDTGAARIHSQSEL